MPKSAMLIFCSIVMATASYPVLCNEDPNAYITPEELENYQFEQPPLDDSYVVSELSIGQQYVLRARRKEAMDLFARHIGVRSLKGGASDLAVIQQLIDRKILRDDQTQQWQAMGVVFGDILVAEFGLTWISFEDDLGVSKALQWRNTDNFVFPVSLFSKRIRFNEKLDAREIYDKLTNDINRFKQLPSNPLF